jgi:type IV secretion system protein VirB8
MKMQPESDRIAHELAGLRDMIQHYPDVQRLLDFAADEADRRAQENQNSRATAWRVAAGAGVVSLIALAVAGGAIATSMQPPPPPQVLVVEKAQGLVQPLISLASYQISPDEATIRRNVATFLHARESYSYENADADYITAGAFMSPQLQAQWAEYWKDPANSPVNKYKQHVRVRVTVGAITLLRNPAGAFISARASFTRQELDNNVPAGEPTNWIATITFHWVNQPTDEQTRRINDLGWEVTDYVADRDAPTPKQQGAPMLQATQPPPASPMALVGPGDGQKVTP